MEIDFIVKAAEEFLEAVQPQPASGVRSRAPEGVVTMLEQALAIYKNLAEDNAHAKMLVQRAHEILQKQYGPDVLPGLRRIVRHDALGGYSTENALELYRALRVLRH